MPKTRDADWIVVIDGWAGSKLAIMASKGDCAKRHLSLATDLGGLEGG